MNRFNMTLKKSDEAISPVIGVMLMLAVTLIIGVVVVSFSTGLVADTQSAPNAVLEVKIDRCLKALGPVDADWDGEMTEHEGSLYGPDITITQVSGDEIPTKDLELHFTWEHVDEKGKTCSHYSVYSAAKFSKQYPDGMTVSQIPRMQPLYAKSPGGALGVQYRNHH